MPKGNVNTMEPSVDSDFRIVLLGTGGGRFTTITQKRRTAGIRIMHEDLNAHLDPGPGALVHSIEEGLDPQQLNAILVSHCHPDHYTDAEVLVEAMTRGMTQRRGALIGSRSVLNGNDEFEPSISKYHQRMTERTIEALAGMRFQLGNVGVSVTPTRHADSSAVGFRFQTESGDFAYTSDTEYSDDIIQYYEGVRLLILCVMRPSGKPWKGHMTTGDAIQIVEKAHPEQTVLTHLGMNMISQGPEKEAMLIEERTGVPCIAGLDGMMIDFGKAINMQVAGSRSQRSLSSYL